jgi:hypothetical protein
MAMDSPRETDKPDEIDQRTAEEFRTKTIDAFVDRVLETAVEAFADAHGVGWALRAVKIIAEVDKWRQVGEGDRAVAISEDIPVGPGINLELATKFGSDEDAPRFSVSCVPDGGSDVGVLQIDRFEVGPSTEDESADTPSGHPGVDIISADLSTPGKLDSRLRGSGALEGAARRELPQLRSRLQGQPTRFITEAFVDTGRVLWLRVNEDGHSSLPNWRIRIEVDPATGRIHNRGSRKVRRD